MVARITGDPNHLDTAVAAAESIISKQSGTPDHIMYATAGLALLAAQNGDESAAEKYYEYFLTHRATMISTVISVDRLLGLMCQSMGKVDQSVAHFEDALAFCRKAGYRPELAWSCCDLADILFEGQSESNRAKTLTMFNVSLSIATELGMRPLMERVKVRLDRIQAVHPNTLTPREVDVLRLIVAGKTNREIAEDLSIGVTTVYTHVSNILGKTNTANRTEAAFYANDHGLV